MSDQAGLFELPDPVQPRPPAAVRGLALTACPATDVSTHAEIQRSFAAAWQWAADPHAPLAAIPGVTWTSVEVTVEQVLARAR